MFRFKFRIIKHLTVRNVYTTSSKFPIELSIPVPWGKIAGKWWGPTDIKPILTLHGYQDNCGSFDRLLPILCEKRDVSFLAIDFPGHGFSSRFPRGMIYDFLNFPILVKRILDYFDWSTVSFMGHSLGAMTSFSYTLFYPEAVKFLICIDGLNLLQIPISAESLRKNIDNIIKYDNHRGSEETVAFTLDELTQKVTSVHNNSVKPEFAKYLMERNVRESKKFPGLYYFARDPMLKVRIHFHWPNIEIMKDVHRVTQPIFISKSKGSSYYEPRNYHQNVLEQLKNSSEDCDFHYLDGTHHLHLNEPEIIGKLIMNFLDKHYKPEGCNIESKMYN